MKKILLISLLLCIINKAYTQEEKKDFPYKNSFKIYPLSYKNNSFIVNCEFFRSKHYSLVFSEGFYFTKERQYSVNEIINNKYKYTNIGILNEFQLREYLYTGRFSENNWMQLFFAPFIFYNRNTISDYYDIYNNNTTKEMKKYKVHSYGIGLLLGCNFVFKCLSIDFYSGYMVKTCRSELSGTYFKRFNGGYASPFYQGIAPKTELTIGFNF